MEQPNEVQTNQQSFMSPTIAKLATALSKAQGEMEGAKKGSEADAGSYTYTYADLASIIQAAKKPLTENGLSITQIIKPDLAIATVITLLLHTSGEWIKSIVVIKPSYATPQGMGSAISYARRYGYQAIIGLSAEDDDGNKASATVADKGAKTPKDATKINAFQMGQIKAQGQMFVDAVLKECKIDALEKLPFKQAGDIVMGLKDKKPMNQDIDEDEVIEGMEKGSTE